MVRSSRDTVEAARPIRRAISRTPWPRSRNVAMRWRANKVRYRDDRVSSATRPGGNPPASARHRHPVLRPMPICRHASTVGTPFEDQLPVLVLHQPALAAPSRHLHALSDSRSVATSLRTHPSTRGQTTRTQRHLAAFAAPSTPAVGGRLPTGDGRPLRGLQRDHRDDRRLKVNWDRSFHLNQRTTRER